MIEDDGGFALREGRGDEILDDCPYLFFCEVDPEGPMVDDVFYENEKSGMFCQCQACTEYRQFILEVDQEARIAEAMYPQEEVC